MKVSALGMETYRTMDEPTTRHEGEEAAWDDLTVVLRPTSRPAQTRRDVNGAAA